MSVKVSPKFQVVIPEQVRSSLGLKAGTQVEVLVKGGIAYIVPIKSDSELRARLKSKLDSKNLREKKDRKL